jgi:hypothetical protein
MKYLVTSIIIALAGCSNDPGTLSGRSGKNEAPSTKTGDATKNKDKAPETAIETASASTASETDAAVTPVAPPAAVPATPPADPVGPQFTVSPAQAVNQNLGVSKSYTYTLTPIAGFTGKVAISIDQKEFSVLDTAKGTIISALPTVVDFSAGSAQTVAVTVNVGTISPSIKAADAAGHFKLVGAIGANKIETTIGMTINAVFETKVTGSNAATMVFTPDLKTMDFKSHTPSLELRFINMDPAATNVIHGNGSIPHGPTGSPMAASADGVAPGGSYIVTIAPTTVAKGAFYSHSYEAGGQARTMNFGK